MLLNKMQHIQFLVVVCLSALTSSQLEEAAVSVGDTISVTPNLTSFSTSTVTLTSPSRIMEPLIDGRCFWDEHVRRWTCKRKGFACDDDYVCIDLRTELQKQADRQEAADGENGRCLFNFESRTFGCTQNGFECKDEVLCVDKRTVWERIMDEEKEAEARASPEKRKQYMISSTIGGVIGAIPLLLTLFCCCACCLQGCSPANAQRDEKKAAKRTQKQQAKDAEKAKKEQSIALQEINKTKAKEEQRQAKRDREVEDAVVKAIQKSKTGNQEQKDLIAQQEKTRAAKAQGDDRTQAPQASGAQPRRSGYEGTNEGDDGSENGHNTGGELPPYSVESFDMVGHQLDSLER